VADENIIFNLAEAFISQTARPVFLTGKAGTGKTTFLKHIKETTAKKTVVVAPTGVAAIHAGGTTIHSFFQLPFTPFVPEVLKGSVQSGDMSDRYSLLNNMKVESEKRNLFREMELLIIDEVSMVRCDTLDAMDTVLRHFRRKPFVPFGGVQVLFIGDLFQLPPVAPDDQWEILKPYYEGPFFFDAHVLQKSRPLYIELKKIYRQSDERFISILNNIRNNEVEEEDLLLLNERYQPGLEPPAGENYITLTTHNHKADTINAGALAKLSTPLCQFEGIVEGDFPERNFPTDRILQLKAGSQVMFIKNDMEKVRRYYNGKIGTIKRIEEERIVVCFPHEENELEVEKDTWNNIRYTFNPKTRQVEEEILGTFTQYAIRLAWGITIHKSQGLTFSKAIIDAGKSFAPGQVYVALSRCTSIQGIVLHSRIFRNSIMTDERVIRFAEEESSPEELRPILQVEQQQYALNTLLDFFDWRNIITELENFKEQLVHRKFQRKKIAEELFELLLSAAQQQHLVAQKFQEQLKKLFREATTEEDYHFLTVRVTSASDYFAEQLDAVFLNPLLNHQKELTGKAGVKGYIKQLKVLISFFSLEKERLQKALDITNTILTR
jgi:nucleoside-triphosphatase THEP1